MPKLLVDLDGVLVNFIKQLGDLIHKDLPLDYEIKENWIWGKMSKAGEDFWESMPWMPEGHKLWDAIKKYDPTILSAPTRAASSVEGKKKWLKNNLPGVPYIIEHDKSKYAKPDAILIDDREKNIKAWEEAGGIGILHKNSDQTLKELEKIMSEKSKKRQAYVQRMIRASIILRNTAKKLTTKHLLADFNAIPLPYSPDALEPILSRDQVLTHYIEHHHKYVRQLNELVDEKNIDAVSLPDLIQKDKGSDVTMNASQVLNHNLYWKSLKPAAIHTEPQGKLTDIIADSFGDVEDMKKKLKKSGMSLTGNGWLWIILEDGKLVIETTKNAESPVEKEGRRPLLTIDLWEHAYYMDYPGKKEEYLDAVLGKLLNWEFAEDTLVNVGK